MALGAGSGQFASTNRRLRHWSDVAPIEQPALFMSEKGGLAVVKALGAPIAWTLHAEFYIYAHTSDPYIAPGTILNPLLDALEQAIAPSPATGIQNLGLPEMVSHAYIAGKVETDEGDSRRPGDRDRSRGNSVRAEHGGGGLALLMSQYGSAEYSQMEEHEIEFGAVHPTGRAYPHRSKADRALVGRSLPGVVGRPRHQAWNVAHAAKETLKGILARAWDAVMKGSL